MGVSIVIGIIVIMTEIIDIELETAANPKTIEDQQYTINRTRRWTPVVIFTFGVALVIVMLGMSMWMTGLRSNISEREGGLVVPKTNLGSLDDPNLGGAGETVPVPDIIPEFLHEKDPNGENPTLSTNSRKSTTELVPSETSAENNRTKRQSMCERFEPDCTPDEDPEPSDPGSSDKGASPDGSSCERFELGCLNPRPSGTIQPEEPMQPEVAETETVLMEPLSNTSKKNLLMKWMTWAQSYVTYVRANSFIWLNESAAMPYISEWNWQMATTALE